MNTGELTVAGVRAPYVEVGPHTSEDAVVFLHGNPGSHADWLDLVAAAGESGRALALDMPGFGQADKPRDFDYTLDGYGRWLAAALEQLGVRKAHLVMHDYGGAFGLTWGLAHPDAFASAVLIATGVLEGYTPWPLARVWQTPVAGELAMALTPAGALRRSFERTPGPLPQVHVDRMVHDFDRGTKHAVLRLYRATKGVGADAHLLREALHPLDRPCLVLWGARDPFIPVAFAARQKESFPRAQVEVLERSGHWPFLDDPHGAAAAIVPFLREQVGA